MAPFAEFAHALLDLKNFRETLATLQRQVDDLDELKVAHYQDVLEHQEEVWNVVQSKVSLQATGPVVRLTFDRCVWLFALQWKFLRNLLQRCMCISAKKKLRKSN